MGLISHMLLMYAPAYILVQKPLGCTKKVRCRIAFLLHQITILQSNCHSGTSFAYLRVGKISHLGTVATRRRWENDPNSEDVGEEPNEVAQGRGQRGDGFSVEYE